MVIELMKEKLFKYEKTNLIMENHPKNKSNYDTFLYSNLENYKGKWIVILDKSIIAFGDDIKKLLEEASKKYPGKKFMLAKVPTTRSNNAVPLT
jgi:hypothetical protein